MFFSVLLPLAILSETSSMQPVRMSAMPTYTVEFESASMYLCTGRISTKGSVATMISIKSRASGNLLRRPFSSTVLPESMSIVWVNIALMSLQYIKQIAISVPKCSRTSKNM